MWVFMSDSFLSIVADSTVSKSDCLLVRARREGDIERVFPEAKVTGGRWNRLWKLQGFDH